MGETGNLLPLETEIKIFRLYEEEMTSIPRMKIYESKFEPREVD